MIPILAAEAGGRVAGVGFPLLTALVVVPAIGALLVGLLPRTRPELARLTGALVSGVVGAMAIVALVALPAVREPAGATRATTD